MKTLIAALALFALLSQAQASKPSQRGKAKVKLSTVNIYEGSDTKSKVCGSGKKDEELEFDAEEPVNGFYKVRYKGKDAYVMASQVDCHDDDLKEIANKKRRRVVEQGRPAATPTKVPTAKPREEEEEHKLNRGRAKKGYAMITADGCKIYSGNSTNSKLMGVAEEGELLPFLKEMPSTGYYKVLYKGKVCFVATGCLDVHEDDLREIEEARPTQVPTRIPTRVPTPEPTEIPTRIPTQAPTAEPTEAPTAIPTRVPPTAVPVQEATEAPTRIPTRMPLEEATEAPTAIPTRVPPTAVPVQEATEIPTRIPTKAPTAEPTEAPTLAPTPVPTRAGTDFEAAKLPTAVPTEAPVPTRVPPTAVPTQVPYVRPTDVPTVAPTRVPTLRPMPTSDWSWQPTPAPMPTETVRRGRGRRVATPVPTPVRRQTQIRRNQQQNYSGGTNNYGATAGYSSGFGAGGGGWNRGGGSISIPMNFGLCECVKPAFKPEATDADKRCIDSALGAGIALEWRVFGFWRLFGDITGYTHQTLALRKDTTGQAVNMPGLGAVIVNDSDVQYAMDTTGYRIGTKFSVPLPYAEPWAGVGMGKYSWRAVYRSKDKAVEYGDDKGLAFSMTYMGGIDFKFNAGRGFIILTPFYEFGAPYVYPRVADVAGFGKDWKDDFGTPAMVPHRFGLGLGYGW